jgi:hypothetical protein
MAKSLEISSVKAQRRNWLDFWARDKSWIMGDNFASESWSPLGEDVPHGIRKAIAAKKSLLGVVFSPAGFPIIDVMPHDITFTAEYFIGQLLTRLHQHRMSLSQDRV